MSRFLRIRCIGHAPGFLNRPSVEEPQGRQPLRNGGRGYLTGVLDRLELLTIRDEKSEGLPLIGADAYAARGV